MQEVARDEAVATRGQALADVERSLRSRSRSRSSTDTTFALEKEGFAMGDAASKPRIAAASPSPLSFPAFTDGFCRANKIN